MRIKACAPQKILEKLPNQINSNIQNRSELAGIGLYEYPVPNRGITQNDWHTDPTNSLFREIITQNVAEIIMWNGWGQYASQRASALENQLFMEAASMEDYLNQETLYDRVQLLIQRKWNDGDFSQPVSRHLASSLAPSFMPVSSFGMQNMSSNSNAPYPTANYCMDSGINMSMTDNTNLFGMCEGYNLGGANMYSNCDGNNVLSPLGTGQLDGGAFSVSNQQYISDPSLKNNSRRHHPDPTVFAPFIMTENFESGYSNFEITPQVTQMVQEVPNIFPKAFNRDSLVLEDVFQYQPVMLASQQYVQHHIRPCIEFTMPSEADSKCYDIKQDKSYCEMARQNGSKHLQLPLEQLPGISNAAAESPVFTSFSNCAAGPNFDISKLMQRPLKRLKLVNPFSPFSPEDRTSPLLDPLMDQSPAPQGLAQTHHFLEASMYISSEVTEEDTESFMNVTEALTINGEFRDGKTDDSQRFSPERVPCISAKLIVDSKEEVDPSSMSGITITEDSDKFNTEISESTSEDINVGVKEEAILVIDNFIQGKAQRMCELIAPAACHRTVLEVDKAEVEGVSLTEFFTAEQIKEHISSLKHESDQVITKEGMGDTILQAVPDACQLCATNKLLFAPPPIYCSFCNARIKHKVTYYCTLDKNGSQLCFCSKCFLVSRHGVINFNGNVFCKAKLHKKKNEEEIEESWVECSKCKSWQHQICTLYNDKRDLEGKAKYTCPMCCLKELNNGEQFRLPTNSVSGAKDLPTTKLSDYIEQRLLRRLKQERDERANAEGKKLDEVAEAADLVVRVVLSVDRQLKVKDNFYKVVQGDNYPDEFSYRSKVILVFQNIGGVDVCIFGMFSQEFGSECGLPNQRCVYISYLDSVKYFTPEIKTVKGEALRTFVYHEILIGYLDYCKKQGFTTCYIWACPPSRGEDYILNCHPKNQRTPKPDKLRQWYQSMLRKAVKENVVVDSTNFYDHFFVSNGECNSKVTAARLPYFDGDYWTAAAEEVIRNIEQGSGGASQEKVKKVMTKRALKSMGHSNPSGDGVKDILLMQKLGQAISPVKEDFIVAYLQFVCSHCREVILSGTRWSCYQCLKFQLCERCHDAEPNLEKRSTHAYNSKETHSLTQVVNEVPSETDDYDVMLDNGLFENRHTFLSFCQNHNYQFDALRRAKHSSMMILYFLKKMERHKG